MPRLLAASTCEPSLPATSHIIPVARKGPDGDSDSHSSPPVPLFSLSCSSACFTLPSCFSLLLCPAHPAFPLHSLEWASSLCHTQSFTHLSSCFALPTVCLSSSSTPQDCCVSLTSYPTGMISAQSSCYLCYYLPKTVFSFISSHFSKPCFIQSSNSGENKDLKCYFAPIFS